MRIIAGKYKGRRFDIPRLFNARPTTDFAKEGIFDVMAGYVDLPEATALDLFSGTGGIALEMLSRGCAKVISVEADRGRHAFIRQCLGKIGDTNCVPLRMDAFRFIKSCRIQFDLIFADPPYGIPRMGEMPGLILGGNLLKAGGLFILEHGKDHSFATSPRLVDHRTYGSVNFSLFM